MRYSDETGHWQLWDDQRQRWVDLYTADTNRALAAVRRYMTLPEGESLRV